MMRQLGSRTIYQRGCEFCNDAIYNAGNHATICPHSECPYRVLDGIENWKQYDALARKRSARMLRELGMERKKYRRKEVDDGIYA